MTRFVIIVLVVLPLHVFSQEKGDLFVVKTAAADDLFSLFQLSKDVCEPDLKSAQKNTIISFVKDLPEQKCVVLITRAYVRENNPDEEVVLNKYYCVKKSVIKDYFEPYTKEPKNFRDLVFYRIENMLISEGVLHESENGLNNATKKTEKQMRERIRNNFTPPNYFLNENYTKLIRNQNPAYLGSTFLRMISAHLQTIRLRYPFWIITSR